MENDFPFEVSKEHLIKDLIHHISLCDYQLSLIRIEKQRSEQQLNLLKKANYEHIR